MLQEKSDKVPTKELQRTSRAKVLKPVNHRVLYLNLWQKIDVSQYYYNQSCDPLRWTKK